MTPYKPQLNHLLLHFFKKNVFIELSEDKDCIFMTLGYSTLPDELEHTINYFLLKRMRKLAYGHNTITMSEAVLES